MCPGSNRYLMMSIASGPPKHTGKCHPPTSCLFGIPHDGLQHVAFFAGLGGRGSTGNTQTAIVGDLNSCWLIRQSLNMKHTIHSFTNAKCSFYVGKACGYVCGHSWDGTYAERGFKSNLWSSARLGMLT